MTKTNGQAQRKVYELRSSDIDQLARLIPVPGVAFKFWKALCRELGLDPKSVICQLGWKFSALPAEHEYHWCYPSKLICPKRAQDIKFDKGRAAR